MTPDQILSPDSKMDLPPPVLPHEGAQAPEASPVLQQGTEVNPEFLPKVSTDQQQPPSAQAQAPAAGSQPTTPANDGATVPAQSATTTQHTTVNPDLAEDVDLIEKEWVEKAKAIVNHTKDDPRRQNHEINKMKADYIKKRYNKDIQVSE